MKSATLTGSPSTPKTETMPLELSKRDDALLVTASRTVTYAEVCAVMSQMAGREGRAGLSVVVDARQVTDVPSTPELRRIVTEMQPLFAEGSGSIAIVASTPFVYGVARMFAVFAQAVSVTVVTFRCMEAMESWLAARRVA